MGDFIQVSEVNKVLNKRREYFTPKLGSFYEVEVGDDKEVKCAKLASIDYANDFPYLCNVIVRNTISIDGEVASPAKLKERRFNYSGTSEDGKSELRNLSEEDRVKSETPSDIDTFNGRSPKNVLECVSRTERSLAEWILTSSVIVFGLTIGFINVLSLYDINHPSVLAKCAIFSWMILAYVMALVATMYGDGVRWRSSLVIVRICMFVAIFLSICDIASLTASNRMSWTDSILHFVALFMCLPFIAFFYSYLSPRSALNKARRSVFMVGHFNKFITGDGKSVVITNKFGSDDNYPMEGYIIVFPEIRNGDSVVKESTIVTHKWSYSGQPEGHDEGDVNLDNCALRNTLEDAKFVLNLFDKQYGVKSNSKTKKVSGKAVNGDDMFENQTSFFAKTLFIIKNMLSSRSEKIAYFMLIAWVVDAIFDYKLPDFLSYIIPVLAVLLAVCGAKSKLKI